LAPAGPNVPWTPSTSPGGEIIAGAPPTSTAPRSNSYVLPPNARAAGEAPALALLDKSHAYTLAELIDLAQSHNPLHQGGLGKRSRYCLGDRNRQDRIPGEAQDSYVALLAAMGISPLTQIKVADPGEPKLSAALITPIDQIVTEALARRPDVLSAYAAHETSLAKLRAAQAEFMPKLFLSATGSYTSNTLGISTLPALGQGAALVPPTINIPSTHFGATVILGVTVPIYVGGLRRALEGQAREDHARTDARLD